MKITEFNQIRRLATTPGGVRADSAERAGERERPADRVSTEDSARVEVALAAARENAGSARAAKLQAIESAVRQGTYRPDPRRIAQEILDDAELAARLQALFSK
jgi:negative regulator of flagellin synthesis FlgM